jgi:hypothetical protein
MVRKESGKILRSSSFIDFIGGGFGFQKEQKPVAMVVLCFTSKKISPLTTI